MLKVENKLILSWGDLESLCKNLAEQIPHETPTVDSVHGIARGGLIPAVMVSHLTGLPYVDVIGPNTLVIDDIADSGETLAKAPGVYTAVLHYKPHTSNFRPNIWVETHEGDEWIVYPFEKTDAMAKQDYLLTTKDREQIDIPEWLEIANEILANEPDEPQDERDELNLIGGLTMPKTNTNKLNK
jgi:hypoxanthine phosphoribosyltransferase